MQEKVSFAKVRLLICRPSPVALSPVEDVPPDQYCCGPRCAGPQRPSISRRLCPRPCAPEPAPFDGVGMLFLGTRSDSRTASRLSLLSDTSTEDTLSLDEREPRLASLRLRSGVGGPDHGYDTRHLDRSCSRHCRPRPYSALGRAHGMIVVCRCVVADHETLLLVLFCRLVAALPVRSYKIRSPPGSLFLFSAVLPNCLKSSFLDGIYTRVSANFPADAKADAEPLQESFLATANL